LTAVVTIGLAITHPREGQTSTFVSWHKALPGMCVQVDLAILARSDAGATEARMVGETKAKLDLLAAQEIRDHHDIDQPQDDEHDVLFAEARGALDQVPQLLEEQEHVDTLRHDQAELERELQPPRVEDEAR
jgi:hypothetical protein